MSKEITPRRPGSRALATTSAPTARPWRDILADDLKDCDERGRPKYQLPMPVGDDEEAVAAADRAAAMALVPVGAEDKLDHDVRRGLDRLKARLSAWGTCWGGPESADVRAQPVPEGDMTRFMATLVFCGAPRALTAVEVADALHAHDREGCSYAETLQGIEGLFAETVAPTREANDGDGRALGRVEVVESSPAARPLTHADEFGLMAIYAQRTLRKQLGAQHVSMGDSALIADGRRVRKDMAKSLLAGAISEIELRDPREPTRIVPMSPAIAAQVERMFALKYPAVDVDADLEAWTEAFARECLEMDPAGEIETAALPAAIAAWQPPAGAGAPPADPPTAVRQLASAKGLERVQSRRVWVYRGAKLRRSVPSGGLQVAVGRSRRAAR